jgi:hypothetical protein
VVILVTILVATTATSSHTPSAGGRTSTTTASTRGDHGTASGTSRTTTPRTTGAVSGATTTSPTPLAKPTSAVWSPPVQAFAPTSPAGVTRYLSGISCPSVTLCVAVDRNAEIFTSTDPGGPEPWRVTALPGLDNRLDAVSCPSPTFCVVVGDDIYTSTDPTGGVNAWVSQHMPRNGILSVSCPSPTFCVALAQETNVLVSDHPVGGRSAWTSFLLTDPSPYGYEAVSCPTASLCVLVGIGGVASVSTDPGGGASAWHASIIGPKGGNPSLQGANGLGAVTCVGLHFCLATDSSGGLVATTNPTGGASAWSLYTVPGAQRWDTPSCPTSQFCAAPLLVTDGSGAVAFAVQPATGPGSWGPLHLVPGGGVLSCPTVNRCFQFVGTGGGEVATITLQ